MHITCIIHVYFVTQELSADEHSSLEGRKMAWM